MFFSPRRFVALCGSLAAGALLLAGFWLAFGPQTAPPAMAAPSVPNAPESNPVRTGQIGGQAQAIALSGDTIVAAFGAALDIYTAADPAQMERASSIYFPTQPVVDVAVHGNFAYGVTSRLFAVDISDPSNAMMAGETALVAKYEAISIQDDLIYAVSAENAFPYGRLYVFDISTPTQPFWRGEIELFAGAYGVATANNIAYVAASSGSLRLVNVADPANLQTVGTFATRAQAFDVVIDGTTAYVAVANCLFNCPGGVQILDISNPTAPVELSFIQLSHRPTRLHVVNNELYIVDAVDGLRRYDVSNGALPQQNGTYIASESFTDIVADADHAFVMAADSGLLALDVTGPIQQIGRVGTAATVGAVAQHGQTMFVGDETGFRIADVTTPTLPQMVGVLDTNRPVNGIVVSGTVGYLANETDGLWTVDLNDLSAPQLLGQLNTPGSANKVVVHGDYAYVADGSAGVRVVDISNPAMPQEVAAFDTAGDTRDLVLQDDLLLLADWDRGLRLLDVSNPLNPIELGLYNTPGEARGVSVSGDIAYIADNLDGIRIINISNPASPFEVGSFITNRYVQDVAVVGDFLYVANDDFGLLVLDVGNPAAPVQTGSRDTAGRVLEVVVGNDGYVYVADWVGGALSFIQPNLDLGGQILQANGLPFSGAVVAISNGDFRVSGSNGAYIVPGIGAGTYVVTPTLADFAFLPPTATVTIPGPQLDVNFTVVRAPQSTTVNPGVTTTLTVSDTQPLPTVFTLPAGAVATTTTLVVTSSIAADVNPLTFAGHAFDIALFDGNANLGDVTFVVPVTIELSYSDADVDLVGTEGSLRLYRRDGIGWELAEESCSPAGNVSQDLAANLLTTQVCRTGEYALFGDQPRLFLPYIGVR